MINLELLYQCLLIVFDKRLDTREEGINICKHTSHSSKQNVFGQYVGWMFLISNLFDTFDYNLENLKLVQ